MLGKRLINSNSAAAGGSCTTDTLQILGDTSCVAYYKMSDATDESGNFDGTPTSVNFNVAGKFGNAAVFNGSSSVITGTAPSVGSSFCVSMWIKPSAYGEKNFYNLWVDSSNLFQIGLNENSNGSLKVSQKNGNTWYVFNTSATPISSLNSWYHIVVNRSSSDLKIYVNDSFIESADNYYNPSSAYGTFNIGSGKSTSNNSFFNGSIDQVRIFNKTLSSTEVTTLRDEVYCVPTIVPTDYFNSVLWSNGVAEHKTPITGVGFQSDLTWIKMRDAGQNHVLTDSVRGVTKTLESSTSDAQETVAQGLTAFNSDGFALGNDARFNSDERSGVAWNWLGGGSSNTFNVDGTGYSTASAAGLATGTDTPTGASVNTAGGFSIIKLTASSTADSDRTVAHGLGVKPSFVLFRRTASSAWFTWSAGLSPESYYLYLQDSYGVGDLTQSGNAWGNQSFTSQHISWRNSWTFSPNEELIAYVFADVDGYQKSGSYVGTGATDNPIVTGFRPAFVMVKGSSNSGSWIIYDNKRNTSNPRNTVLYADSSTAESTNTNLNIDFNSNGFVLTGADTDFNGLNRTYIYLALAEEVYDPTDLPTLQNSFKTVTYTGNDSTNARTDVGFAPDLVWIKARTDTRSHTLIDSVRGATRIIQSESTGVEWDGSSYITSLDSSGFTVKSSAAFINNSSQDYVAWCWKAGGTPAINQDGSITSLVSANPNAGFSVVKFTGDGNAATVGHGLDSAPELILLKNLDSSLNWITYSLATGADKYGSLNLSDTFYTDTRAWNNTSPTDSVFSASNGSFTPTNENGSDFIAYCFTSITGYQKIGSYQGDDSTNESNIINVGFQPSFVMIKNTTSGSTSWVIADDERGYADLYANVADAEFASGSLYGAHFTSVGFTFGTADISRNESNNTYIYLAIA